MRHDGVMEDSSFAAQLQQARQELAGLNHERAQLEGKIAWVQAVIAKLERLCGEPADRSAVSLADVIAAVGKQGGVTAGLTDSCRRVLRAARRALQAHEVVLVLENSGFLTSRYVSPLSAVVTVLHRLVERGQARVVASSETGRPLFRWKAPSRRKKTQS